MLDKTIPWHSFIMSKEFQNNKFSPMLPENYSLRKYKDLKDEVAWAKIETAVGEFNSIADAVECHKNYLNEENELKNRQWFVVNKDNEPVATATLWWSGKDRIPCIHALSCLPEYQGLGLGKIVAMQILDIAVELHPNQAVWLETQTWSWKAICLYLKLGFIPRKNATFNETNNDYDLTIEILKEKLDKDIISQIESLAK